MERCSIHVPTTLCCLLLLVLVAHAAEKPLEMQLAAATQATPTPLWAVDWGPTQPLEDETQHFPSTFDTESMKPVTADSWLRRRNTPPNDTQSHPLTIEAWESAEEQERDAAEREIEEVDPQFYVTVTISSLLILSALIISAKLCYDRSLSQRPPPLSLAIPRALAQEDSRHTLQSTPSFPDRERIPVVNL